MKRLLLLATVIAAFTACVSEHHGWGEEDTPESENVGYLSFGEDGIQVFLDHEEGEGDVEPQASTSAAPTTRAISADALADYNVEIIQDGVVKQSFKYGAWKAAENYKANHVIDENHTVTGLELPVGTYTVRVFSAEAENVSAAPQYEGSQDVTLRKGQMSEANVECTLSSVKVTVTFDPILADVIDATNTSVMARLDEEGVASPSAHTWSGYADKAALTKSHDQIVATYLKPQAATETGSPLNIYLTTIYGGTEAAGTGSQINAQKLPVGNVNAGEWRKVTVKLDHGTDGTVYFVVTVETWAYNQQIDVTQEVYAASLGEMEIPDVTDAPVIETPVGGLDLTQAMTLTEDMFTAGVYNGNASMTVKTKQPIKALYLSATSDSEGLPELISYLGLDTPATEGTHAGLNLAGTLNAAFKSILGTWGFPTANIAGQTELTFNVAGLLAQLQSEESYTGNHSFSLTIVDAKENNATYTLQVTSGNEPDVSVKWSGYNMAERYEMTADLNMIMVIKAKGGIEHLYVSIGGIKEAVEEAGIPSSFDIVEPGYALKIEGGKLVVNDDGSYVYDTEISLSNVLTELGIPVGDAVKGKEVFEFDISGFKSMLSVFGGNNADFNVRVVNKDGAEATGSMLIKIP